MFNEEQKKVYQELNGTFRTEGTTPGAEESKLYWGIEQ